MTDIETLERYFLQPDGFTLAPDIAEAVGLPLLRVEQALEAMVRRGTVNRYACRHYPIYVPAINARPS